MAYRVFVRNWWRRNAKWPGGREPYAGGRRKVIARRVGTEAEARRIAKGYNASHDPGFLSRKAEYEEV